MIRTAPRPSSARALRIASVAAVISLVGALLAIAQAPSADAAGRLSVSSEIGGSDARTDGPTNFSVSGSGYQVVEGGFGGVYLVFGWVSGGNWGPSNGGVAGSNYRYVPDSESRNNQGYIAFVSFPGSSTEGEAQATMSPDGSFSVNMVVPGPRFRSEDRSGNVTEVDCLQVTCGFFTFGAHGVKNASNETFTPVSFVGGAPAAEEGGQADTPASDAGGGAAPGAEGNAGGSGGAAAPRAGSAGSTGGGAGGTSSNRSQNAAAAAEVAAERASARTGVDRGGNAAGGSAGRGGAGGSSSSGGGSNSGGDISGIIEVDRAAAKPGGAMGYTAYGFLPGEQVVVQLADGLVAAGPLTAGSVGEIAGVIVLPEDIPTGTHSIKAIGAGSGIVAEENFAIRNIALTGSDMLTTWAKWSFLALCILVFLAAIAWILIQRAGGISALDRFRRGGSDNDPNPEYDTEHGEAEYLDNEHNQSAWANDYYGSKTESEVR